MRQEIGVAEMVAPEMEYLGLAIDDDGEERKCFLRSYEKFSDLARLQPGSRHFLLLTAFDLSRISDDEMSSVAQALVKKGLAYACCWGESSERWHDAIDRADMMYSDVWEQSGRVIMTTWHNIEPLSEAVWFLRNCAVPNEAYSSDGQQCILAVSPEFADEVRCLFLI